MTVQSEIDAAAVTLAAKLGESITYHSSSLGDLTLTVPVERFDRDPENGVTVGGAILRIPNSATVTVGITAYNTDDEVTLPLRHRDDTATRHRTTRYAETDSRMFWQVGVIEGAAT